MNEPTADLTLVYQGPTRVHLQGQNALVVVSAELSGEIRYFLGCENTNLMVRDFRSRTTVEALEVIQRQNQNGFARLFNQNAFVEIHYNASSESIEISLRDTDNFSENIPLLWMGILENNLMPSYRVEWEIFKAVDKNNTAFVAFIVPAILHHHP